MSGDPRLVDGWTFFPGEPERLLTDVIEEALLSDPAVIEREGRARVEYLRHELARLREEAER